MQGERVFLPLSLNSLFKEDVDSGDGGEETGRRTSERPHCRSLSPELSRPTDDDGRRSQLAHARTDGSLLSEHVNGAPGAVGRFARIALPLARGGGYRGEGDCGSSNSR